MSLPRWQQEDVPNPTRRSIHGHQPADGCRRFANKVRQRPRPILAEFAGPGAHAPDEDGHACAQDGGDGTARAVSSAPVVSLCRASRPVDCGHARTIRAVSSSAVSRNEPGRLSVERTGAIGAEMQRLNGGSRHVDANPRRWCRTRSRFSARRPIIRRGS